MRALSLGLAAMLFSVAAVAQTTAARPAYEAATVKVNNSGSRGSSSHGSRGQVLMTNMTLRRLVERAFDVKPVQVAGPDWMEDVHFDIAAKYPADMKIDDRSAMLRTLLEERFHLTTHRETREVAGYALVAARNGFKLQPVEPGGAHIDSDGETVQVFNARKVSMALLADHLSRSLGDIVVDQTGLSGVYDFQLRWANEESAGGNEYDRKAARFGPIQDALSTIGLHLRAQKVPMEVVVVDSAERMPVEN